MTERLVLMEYTLLWVVDAQLLQKQAVVQEAAPHLGQELQHDSSLRSQENHGVVAMRAGGVIHGYTCQTVSRQNTGYNAVLISFMKTMTMNEEVTDINKQCDYQHILSLMKKQD